ncbi:MAG: NAD(P)-dependent oxidoreductase [Candidatus Heimdallarchaeota archaeon]|nr:NAD(P)-dependent oxidoreductase [Candidatus Heimdallarchaeota archaeon]MDH5646004.1 NAD(P)-dependent oxidoreductase [Candidatus Heimdallarchaeota archaeon]
MVNIFVTGATGFFGKNFVNKFKQSKNKLICISRTNLPNCSDFVEYVKGDLLSINDIRNIFEKYRPKIVIHSATEYPNKHSTKFKLFNSNYLTSINLLAVCIEFKITNFINISSASVYNSINKCLTEIDDINPKNNYSLAKYAFEELLSRFSQIGNFKAISLRFFHVYGPFDHKYRLIPSVINSILNNFEKIKLLSSCEQEWDLIYIEDVVNLVESILKNIENWNFETHEIFNVGSGISIKLQEVVYKIREIMQSNIKIDFNHELGEMEFMKADISKLTNYFHWHPSYSLYQGLENTISYFEKIYESQSS